MLVLSRKRDEKIIMTTPSGEKIVLTVIRIDRYRVRLGIDAPDEVTILRSELIDGNKKKKQLRRQKQDGATKETANQETTVAVQEQQTEDSMRVNKC